MERNGFKDIRRLYYMDACYFFHLPCVVKLCSNRQTKKTHSRNTQNDVIITFPCILQNRQRKHNSHTNTFTCAHVAPSFCLGECVLFKRIAAAAAAHTFLANSMRTTARNGRPHCPIIVQLLGVAKCVFPHNRGQHSYCTILQVKTNAIRVLFCTYEYTNTQTHSLILRAYVWVSCISRA